MDDCDTMDTMLEVTPATGRCAVLGNTDGGTLELSAETEYSGVTLYILMGLLTKQK